MKTILYQGISLVLFLSLLGAAQVLAQARPDPVEPPVGRYPVPLATIRFACDHIDLDRAETDKLMKVADWMSRDPELRIRLAGHTDERGTDEYNLGLGERRALAVRAFLVKVGIDPARMSIYSYGEEWPLDLRHDAAARNINRRVEIHQE